MAQRSVGEGLHDVHRMTNSNGVYLKIISGEKSHAGSGWRSLRIVSLWPQIAQFYGKLCIFHQVQMSAAYFLSGATFWGTKRTPADGPQHSYQDRSHSVGIDRGQPTRHTFQGKLKWRCRVIMNHQNQLWGPTPRWGRTPEQRVAASTLRRYSFVLRLDIAQADASSVMSTFKSSQSHQNSR